MIKRPFSTALVDLLLGTVVLLLLLIAPPSAESEMEPTADYSLRVTWDREADIDIDTYVLLPNQTSVFYMAKDRIVVTLERDDLGSHKGLNLDNLEVVSFRGAPDGIYYVTIHNYARYTPSHYVTLEFHNRQGEIMYRRTVGIPPEKEETGVFVFEMKGGIATNFEDSEVLIRNSGRAR